MQVEQRYALFFIHVLRKGYRHRVLVTVQLSQRCVNVGDTFFNVLQASALELMPQGLVDHPDAFGGLVLSTLKQKFGPLRFCLLPGCGDPLNLLCANQESLRSYVFNCPAENDVDGSLIVGLVAGQ